MHFSDYESASDFSSLTRALCSSEKLDKTMNVAETVHDPLACFLVPIILHEMGLNELLIFIQRQRLMVLQ